MNWGALSFVLGAVINVVGYAYFTGVLSQSVRDLKDRVESLEDVINSITKTALSKAVGGD